MSSTYCGACHNFQISLLREENHNNTEISRQVESYHVFHLHFEKKNPGVLPEPFFCLDCNKNVVPLLPTFKCPLCERAHLTAGRGKQLDESIALPSDQVSPQTRFASRLCSQDVDLDVLRETLRMNGVCLEFRAVAWQFLLGTSPDTRRLRYAHMAAYRKKYFLLCAQYFRPGAVLTEDQDVSLRQISLDVPRTNCSAYPHMFEDEKMAETLKRVLFIWSVVMFERVGYFQGLNELCVPLFTLFLGPNGHPPNLAGDEEEDDAQRWSRCEADAFWCLVSITEPLLRDPNAVNARIYAVPMTNLERDICARVDEELTAHLVELQLDWMFFAFRWNVCFLVRELPLELVWLIWDYYLLDCQNNAESNGFGELHPFFCCALLMKFRSRILAMNDLTEALMFLQHFPSHDLTERDIKSLVGTAVLLRQENQDLLNEYRTILRTAPVRDFLRAERILDGFQIM